VAACGPGIFFVYIRVDYPVQGIGGVPPRRRGQKYENRFF
jgi:hypothetical protein